MSNELEQRVVMNAMNHYHTMGVALGMTTTWDITEIGEHSADQLILGTGEYKVVYDNVTAVATNSSIKSLWAAAEACMKESGTSHRYIEHFESIGSGVIRLHTGS